MLASYFIHLANYNVWANQRLYQACGGLDEEAYFRERISYFGSIHKTLNHILVADLIWMDRFLNEHNAPARLDAVPHDNFGDLKKARKAMDERILDFAISLTDQHLAEVLHYKDIQGNPHKVPLSICVGHMLNHHTHHRGQVHGMLSHDMKEPPALDLIYFTLEQLEGD